MLRNSFVAAAIVGSLSFLVVEGAAANWRYEERKDPFNDTLAYARAMNSVASPQGQRFHLSLLCSGTRQVNPVLFMPSPVNPTQLQGEIASKVRLRVDNGPTKETRWPAQSPNDRQSQTLLIPAEDWREMVAGQRVTVGVSDIIGLSETILVFDMARLPENERLVREACAKQ